jgi:hypothetical protein
MMLQKLVLLWMLQKQDKEEKRDSLSQKDLDVRMPRSTWIKALEPLLLQ